MGERDDRILETVTAHVWGQMDVMRRSGCTDVEGEIRVDDDVLKASVRAIWPKPAEFIVLTFDLGRS